MSLNIICQNIRGLNVKEKVEAFEEQVKTLQSHIIIIQEHMLVNNKKIDFQNFTSVYLSPDLKKLNELKLNLGKYKFAHEIFIGADWNAPIPKEKEKFHKLFEKINEWIMKRTSLSKKRKGLQENY